MLWSLTWRRLRREWRLLAVLLLAVSLVTGFMALGPTYIRTIAAVELDTRLQAAHDRTFQLDLLDESPIQEESTALLNRRLGELLLGIEQFQRSQVVHCGLHYDPTTPTLRNSETTALQMCYRLFAYPDLTTHFTVVAGRLPVAAVSPEDGPAIIEAVVTQQVSDIASAKLPVQMGDYHVIGTDTLTAAIVRIVGIVEPLDPQNVFWNGQELVLRPARVEVGNFDRYNVGVVVLPEDYAHWVVPAVMTTDYVWRLSLDREQISVDSLDNVTTALDQLKVEIKQDYPEILVREQLTPFLTQFRADIAAAKTPIFLLSCIALAVLLYNLVAIVTLVLERQKDEWMIISSRGGSKTQLVVIQFSTAVLLGGIGAALGPVVAQGILLALTWVGPQAAILRASDLGVIPPAAWQLSIAAGLVSVVMLTLPTWAIAGRALTQLQQNLSRPPDRPLWARFFLDFMLLLIGFAFLARMYTLVGADIEGGVLTALRDPAQFIRLIATRGNTQGLEDPFNLAGPVLLLTGAALLWLRLFPWLMRLIGLLARRSTGLLVRLAWWGVERNPGYYSQLVLLLIGALALGTASLALTTTLRRGAWDTARLAAGGDARIDWDSRQAETGIDWLALPDVTAAAPITLAVANSPRPNEPLRLFGVDYATIVAVTPPLADLLAPLAEFPPPAMRGIALPEDVAQITLDAYIGAAEAGQPIASPDLMLEFVDSAGATVILPLTMTRPGVLGEFVEYVLNFDSYPRTGRWPLYWTGIRFRLDTNDNQIYLDNLRVTNSAGERTPLLRFEPGDFSEWQWSERDVQQVVAHLTEDESIHSEGENSLHVWIRMSPRTHLYEPTLQWGRIDDREPLPVILSSALAARAGLAAGQHRPLIVGDEFPLTVNLPLSGALPTSVSLRGRVIGISDRFPTAGDGEYLIADERWLSVYLNEAIAYTGQSYDRNQVWLALAGRAPSNALRALIPTLPGVTGSEYAWDQYSAIRRDILVNAVTGVLFAGFWVALGLSVVGFGLYTVITTRRRVPSFAALRAIGWEDQNIWQLLLVEQLTFTTPALIIGVGLGEMLAFVLLPFLGLIGNQSLCMPIGDIAGLLGVLVIVFALLSSIAAVSLRRIPMHSVLRAAE